MRASDYECMAAARQLLGPGAPALYTEADGTLHIVWPGVRPAPQQSTINDRPVRLVLTGETAAGLVYSDQDRAYISIAPDASVKRAAVRALAKQLTRHIETALADFER